MDKKRLPDWESPGHHRTQETGTASQFGGFNLQGRTVSVTKVPSILNLARHPIYNNVLIHESADPWLKSTFVISTYMHHIWICKCMPVRVELYCTVLCCCVQVTFRLLL
jgi:hypothetical protein